MTETQRLGSSRVIRPVEPGVVAMRYTNNWSVFERGASPQPIPGLGASRCACAVASFRWVHSIGQGTHFLEQVDDLTIHVREFAVPRQKSLSGKVHGRVLDGEWIRRTHAYGSALLRLSDGRKKPEDFGFAPGTVVTKGMKFPQMIKECSTKFDAVDYYLSDDQMRERMGITLEQWDVAWKFIEDGPVNAVEEGYNDAGFYRPDGKSELGRTPEGRFVHVDVFGTPDEDRIVDLATGELYCKDLIRDPLSKLPWKKELDAAKAAHPHNKEKWPPYPELPEDLVALVARRYAAVAQRYAGVCVTY